MDFSQPIAVMLLGVLNFIAGYDQARRIVRTLLDAVQSGSYLAVAHASNQANPTRAAAAEEFWNNNAAPPITFRNGAEIAGFFGGMELLEPGVVSCSRWRPDVGGPDDLPEVDQFSAIGRKH